MSGIFFSELFLLLSNGFLTSSSNFAAPEKFPTVCDALPTAYGHSYPNVIVRKLLDAKDPSDL